jgi:hypothetical protein
MPSWLSSDEIWASGAHVVDLLVARVNREPFGDLLAAGLSENPGCQIQTTIPVTT